MTLRPAWVEEGGSTMNSRETGVDDGADRLLKASLDKDLTKIVRLEQTTHTLARSLVAPGLSLVFLALAGGFASIFIGGQPNVLFIVSAAVVGGYMALNIGANDVANNVGPAVGARALTMVGALVIAAIFESMGALIAGGDVISTISKGIIDPARVPDSATFVWAMMAALLSSALWINLATWLNAPVSTTHSVVGGVAGAGVAAVGVDLVNWTTMAQIVASWVISPILGGLIAAIFLAFIKVNVIYQDDKIAAARRWVPVLVALMAASFSCYLVMKGLSKLWRPQPWMVAGLGAGVFVVAHSMLRPWVIRQSEGMENRNRSLRVLFHLPLICSAALLSFAHGANDVANAIGPLAAIFHAAVSGDIAARAVVPPWVMLIGAVGIALGLFLYGPRLIRMVGEQITRMNPMRAFCVALSAAITVIIASALGLPVSSTHIAVGAVFGVGFFREYYTTHSRRRRDYVRKNQAENVSERIDAETLRRRKLVRRSHFLTIVAAWVITVPVTAALAAGLYTLSLTMR
jgi:PiT family inorganic phosphate transporter